MAAVAGVAGLEPKGQLNQFCQRYCKRPVTKDDVVYTSQKYGEVYQVTVTLNCMEGQQFVGETGTTQKEAEKNAATQALIHFQPLNDSLPPSNSKNSNKKRKTSANGAAGGVDIAGMTGEEPALKAMKTAAGGVDPAITCKVLLNTLCMKLLRRPMTKNEIAYETNQTPIGFQSTVKLPCLPGEWGELAWAGEVAQQQKQAEQNAAKQALEAVNQGIDSIKSLLPQPQPPKQQQSCKGGKAKGKFKGGGGGWDFWGMKGMGMMGGGMDKGMGKGFGGMGKGMGMDMMGMGKGGWGGESKGGWGGECKGFWGGESKGCWGGESKGGWGGESKGGWGGESKGGWGGESKGGWGGESKGGWGGEMEVNFGGPQMMPRGPMPRNRITEVPITGEIVEWKGKYGWAQPHADIEHPMAKMRGGRVFIAGKDAAGCSDLNVGSMVQFHVYEDPTGLGAEEVSAF